MIVTAKGWDETEAVMRFSNYVWNTTALAWEKSTGGGTGSVVSVSNFPATQAVSGPLTDAQLRAVAVPVSGTFFQATQPVSIAAAVPVTDNGGSLTVDGVFWQATQPVSGTFWQATQPVSIAGSVAVTGPLTDAQLRAVAVPVSGTVTATGPLTDAQLRATAVPITGTLTAVTAITNALPTGANTIGTTLGPTLTKATQGATGYSVQDLKDAGRSARMILLDSFAVAATAETLMTMSYSTDNGTLTTGTSYSVTASKRLRMQSITLALHTIAGNTTAVNVIVRVRVNNIGAGIVSSPVQMVVPIQGVAAANQAGIPVTINFPDGWEFVAGAGIAVTVACSGFVATTAAPKVDISINAYEY